MPDVEEGDGTTIAEQREERRRQQRERAKERVEERSIEKCCESEAAQTECEPMEQAWANTSHIGEFANYLRHVAPFVAAHNVAFRQVDDEGDATDTSGDQHHKRITSSKRAFRRSAPYVAAHNAVFAGNENGGGQARKGTVNGIRRAGEKSPKKAAVTGSALNVFAHEISQHRFKSSIFGSSEWMEVRPNLRSLAKDTLALLEEAWTKWGITRPLDPIIAVGEFGDPSTAGERKYSFAQRLWKGLNIISAKYSPPGGPPVPLWKMTSSQLMCMQVGMIHHCEQLPHDNPKQPYEWVAINAVHRSARKTRASEEDMGDVVYEEAPWSRRPERKCWAASGNMECSGKKECAFGASCPRRFVSRLNEFGPLTELRTVIVLPTENKGNALFALVDISKGQVITGYRGVEYSAEKADERRIAITAEGLTTYHMALEDCDDGQRGSVMEGTVIGSTSRFVSHACKGVANAEAQPWMCGSTAHTVLVAVRVILAGEEITYPYLWSMEKEDIAAFDELTNCACGGKARCSGKVGYSIEEVAYARKEVAKAREKANLQRTLRSLQCSSSSGT